jgi:hypothetical protein
LSVSGRIPRNVNETADELTSLTSPLVHHSQNRFSVAERASVQVWQADLNPGGFSYYLLFSYPQMQAYSAAVASGQASPGAVY